ncbi:hypothetical protein [Gynuella sp.]|uniref:hypothetical protein n=1 Tax=Gynuella sp. TaxID=2969146 RepID=UPI003D125C82
MCLAYVDSRDYPDYHISTEQLHWLTKSAGRLQSLAEKYCQDKLNHFDLGDQCDVPALKVIKQTNITRTNQYRS